MDYAQNVGELCRLCGSDEGIKVDIFQPEQNYVDMIIRFIQIDIKDSDVLPTRMCHRCAILLSEFYEFSLKCVRVQDVLENMLSNDSKAFKAVSKGKLPSAESQKVKDVYPKKPSSVYSYDDEMDGSVRASDDCADDDNDVSDSEDYDCGESVSGDSYRRVLPGLPSTHRMSSNRPGSGKLLTKICGIEQHSDCTVRRFVDDSYKTHSIRDTVFLNFEAESESIMGMSLPYEIIDRVFYHLNRPEMIMELVDDNQFFVSENSIRHNFINYCDEPLNKHINWRDSLKAFRCFYHYRSRRSITSEVQFFVRPVLDIESEAHDIRRMYPERYIFFFNSITVDDFMLVPFTGKFREDIVYRGKEYYSCNSNIIGPLRVSFMCFLSGLSAQYFDHETGKSRKRYSHIPILIVPTPLLKQRVINWLGCFCFNLYIICATEIFPPELFPEWRGRSFVDTESFRVVFDRLIERTDWFEIEYTGNNVSGS